ALATLPTVVPAALGFAAAVKGLSIAIQQTLRLLEEAEESGAEMERILAEVMQKYDNAKPADIGASELVQAAWTELTSIQGDTIKKCSAYLDIYNNKLTGLELEAHKLAEGLGKMRVGITEVEKDLELLLSGVSKIKSEAHLAEVNKLVHLLHQ